MRNMASGSGASQKGIAAIVGVGPKLGRSIARKFSQEGYTVAILARDLGRLSRFAEEIAREAKAQVFAIRIDCSDSQSIREAFEGVLSLGFVEVLVYNAYQQQQPVSFISSPSPSSSSSSSSATNRVSNSQLYPTSFIDVRIDSFEKSLAVSTVGAFHCAQQVLPGMVERRRGTILFTGCSASLNGFPGFSELCCGKFALRALSQCLAKEVQPLGVHVAHVIIDGIIGPPRSSASPSRSMVGEQQVGEGTSLSLDPDALAQTYWYLHVQDRNVWTHEIDLRSSNSNSFNM
ncbi:very-long-chain 3-oxoacyl-CoA reductase [Papaver somniferum]|uniref:very-long-chain 3-oxoacyl-CoA reductase n=1 Tax=Papaver somniferum TaxID=3469 RepID=UPI000E700846|nr:very-long-chain 3-oxoacyl-CoA reductase [Papaver somniferum]XP_026455814.1 very-long-chain 3-oxoacyl-CoA reductase [Papaver somniferum]XP_026455815.1 very-long-chain 3-oxoacyl-CoA reductase [Papaver somniferum]